MTNKGITFERKEKIRLEKAGAIVFRMAASQGVADLIAIWPEARRIELIQCKKGNRATYLKGVKEVEAMKHLEGDYILIAKLAYEEGDRRGWNLRK